MIQINSTLFLQMMQEGSKNLHKHQEMVNSLNVFPVPDGDTGTNMNLTLTSGVKEMEEHLTNDLGGYAEALSKGLLMGARGNSGVILSQLFRGFAKSVVDKTSINGKQLAEAFHRGVQTAYKAVIKPVEGTILTVARQSADAGVKLARTKENIIEIMETIRDEAIKSLNETPEMLAVLKQAGVVDAGGKGLVYIFEGMLGALRGEIKEHEDFPNLKEITALAHEQNAHSKVPSEIEFGYCTEFMIRLNAEKKDKKEFDEEIFKEKIGNYGDSLLVVADDDLVKIHIHAEYPGEVMNQAMEYGDLIGIKIDNMRAQNESLQQQEVLEVESEKDRQGESLQETKEQKDYGIVAVASGDGISAIFKSLGVDQVIEGGQSMNPSIEDMLNAIRRIPANNVFILPNNKNIILTAEQVQEVTDTPITVLPTRTIPEGLSALLAFDANRGVDENQHKMTQSYANIQSGEVTNAVRDSKVNGLEIKNGDIIGIHEGNIEVVGQELIETSINLLQNMISEDTEIITIIYGDDIEEEKANNLKQKLTEMYSTIEVEVYNGGQPVYMFLFSVE